MSADQWARWRHAMAGNRIESERGNPPSGYFKRDAGRGASKPIEAICIYRDNDGKLQCCRDVYGDGSRMDADQIEELFASCWLYPIDEQIYFDVTERGQPWPAEYGTRLTGKEIADGVVWTPELGRKKLGATPTVDTSAENPRAVIGDNRPPEDTPPEGHKLAGEQTPDKLAFAEVSKLGTEVKKWLDSIGGKPRNEDERATIADFKTKFSRLHEKAEKDRKAEKQPHLDAGRLVDERWSRVKDQAAGSRDRCGVIYAEATQAEEQRRIAEAEQNGGEAKPVESVGHLRSVPVKARDIFVVTDARAYLAHLLTIDGEMPSEIVEAAGKVAQRRAEIAPGIDRRTERKAA